MSELHLSKHKRKLDELLPILKEFRYGSCCQTARMKMLAKALSELFDLIDVKYNRDNIIRKPIKYYNAFRSIILENPELTDSEKLKYSKYLE